MYNLNPTEAVAFACILLAMAGLAATITLSNERVRRAIEQARKAYLESALLDLAMRREQTGREISFTAQAEAIRALEQIALDAGGQRRELASLSLSQTEGVPAIVALTKDGYTILFTPSASFWLAANPGVKRRLSTAYPVNGLVSHPFVIEELCAVARFLGMQVVPRTQAWDMVVLSPEDYSIAPVSWLRRLRVRLN